jgi:hypothetical protein
VDGVVAASAPRPSRLAASQTLAPSRAWTLTACWRRVRASSCRPIDAAAIPAKWAWLPAKATTAPLTPRRQDGTELVQDAGAQLGVLKPGGRVGEVADQHRPQVGAVGLPGAELEHDVDLTPGGVEVASPGQEAGGDGVGIHRRAGPPPHSLAREDVLRVNIALGSNQLEPLGHAHVPGVGLLDPLAQPGALLDELRRLAEPAIQQRQRRPPGEREVAETGLADGVGSGEIRVQGGPERRRTGFQEGVGDQEQAFRSPLLITQRFDDGDDVAGQVEPRWGGARGPQHVVAGQEAGQEGGRVVGLPSELERRLAQGAGPGPVVRDRVLELSGHGGGELGLERDVAPGDRLSRRIQRLDEVIAPHREPSPQALQAERDGPDPGRVPARFGEATRTDQQLSGHGRARPPEPALRPRRPAGRPAHAWGGRRRPAPAPAELG